MKRILSLVASLLIPISAYAGACEQELTGVFTAEQATKLCDTHESLDDNLIPTTNSAVDLGSAAKSWEDLFVEKILADNDSTSDIDADAVTAFTAKPLVSVVGTSATQSHIGLIQNVASAQGADIVALKTRAAAGSTNANTIIASGDDILKITAFGSDGAAYINAAQIIMESAGTPGLTTDMPGAIKFLTVPDGSGTLTLALTIEPDQDLLITGDLYLADGQNIGATAANGANAACDTTCTTGCFIGWDAGTSAFVGCGSALADTCMCSK